MARSTTFGPQAVSPAAPRSYPCTPKLELQTLYPSTDLELTYRLRRLTIAAGAQNIFDVFPDDNLPANANLGIFPYPSHSPFGMNGRFLYSRLTVRF